MAETVMSECIVVSPTRNSKRNLTESSATKALSRFFFSGVGNHYLGYQKADEELQPDGSWKKLGTDGFRFWKVPDDEVQRIRWNPVHEHLKGNHRGVVAKGATHVPFVTVDPDRHSASIPEQEHIVRVLKIGRLLCRNYSQYRWLAEVNLRNGSAKFFGFLGRPIPITQAKLVAEEIHELLKTEVGELEVFPHNCTQVGLPMRADKVMIVGDGVLAKCQRKRKNAEGRFESYEAYSALNFYRALRSNYHELTLLRALKQGVAALPYRPGENTQPKTKTPISVERKSMPSATGDYRDSSNSFERQLHGLLELCRRLRRIATVPEGLAYIEQNGLYTGEWQENLARRTARVRYLLKHIAQTFDASQCNGLRYQINVGKYAQWAKQHIGIIKGKDRHDLDEYGNLLTRRNGTTVDWQFVSAFLSVVEYCLVISPNADNSLPQKRAEEVWSQCYAAGLIRVAYCDKKWKVCRDYLEQRGIIRIVDRDWHFGHGNGKAMRWEVSEEFNRLPQWYKRIRKPSINEAVPLHLFLAALRERTHPHPLNSYPHRGGLETAFNGPTALSRAPP